MIDELKPYPEYKNSGLKWVAALPNHWKVERAKGRFQKLNRPIRPEDETVTCFRDGTVTLRKNRRLRGFTEAIYELGYQGIRKGDLVIHAMDAFAGAVGVSDSDGKGSPIYGVCRPKFDDSPHYYAHVVREMSRTQWILALSRGIRERSTDFRFESFARQFVPLPPPDEQAAIVKFLDYANGKIERAIRAKRKLIGLLNEQKQAIIHRAVTRGLDPNVKLKPSGIPWLGDVPEHWNCRAFARMSRVVRGASPRPAGDSRYFNGSHTPWVTVGEVTKDKDIYLTKTETMLKEAGADRSARFAAGTLIMTNSGATLGVPKILSIEACANDGIVAFLNLQTVLDKPFAYYYLSTLTTRLRDELRQGGTQPNLNTGIVKRIVCPLPPLEEQRQILKHIEIHSSPINTAIGRTEREIDLLREYRTTLTAEVVTGKLDVREAAKRLPDEAVETLPPDDSMDELIEDEIDQENEA
jgi:type I restriction enzyme S subunit